MEMLDPPPGHFLFLLVCLFRHPSHPLSYPPLTGEELPVAVAREVLEETGVSAEFVSIGCFRHMHGFRFGKSDIYFVCLMRALSSEIKMCPSEIAACRWMSVSLELYIILM